MHGSSESLHHLGIECCSKRTLLESCGSFGLSVVVVHCFLHHPIVSNAISSRFSRLQGSCLILDCFWPAGTTSAVLISASHCSLLFGGVSHHFWIIQTSSRVFATSGHCRVLIASQDLSTRSLGSRVGSGLFVRDCVLLLQCSVVLLVVHYSLVNFRASFGSCTAWHNV